MTEHKALLCETYRTKHGTRNTKTPDRLSGHETEHVAKYKNKNQLSVYKLLACM